MRPRSSQPGWRATSMTLLVAGIQVACNGCPGKAPCDLKTHTVSTTVLVGNITAPPGQPPTRLFEVLASGFHPNATANLGIVNFPKTTGGISATVTMDGSGSVRWTRDAPLILTTDPDYEPDVDVTTTIAEVATTCLAIAKTKQKEFSKM